MKNQTFGLPKTPDRGPPAKLRIGRFVRYILPGDSCLPVLMICFTYCTMPLLQPAKVPLGKNDLMAYQYLKDEVVRKKGAASILDIKVSTLNARLKKSGIFKPKS